MLSRLVRGVEGNGAWAERSAISVACREGQPRRNALVFTEVAGEAGFDDLVALTQVRLPKRAKLGLARNYWDEMGRGNAKGMHGPMLETLSTAMALRPKAEEMVGNHLRSRTRWRVSQRIGAMRATPLVHAARSTSPLRDSVLWSRS